MREGVTGEPVSESRKSLRRGLPRQVIVLGWVSFFADISSEMIYPLIPLFLVNVLGGTTLALGLIEGVAQGIVSIMSPLSGLTTDRTGRRLPWVRGGYGLPIIGKALLALAGSWHLVFIGRAVDRLGKGLRGSPRDALIADAISAERRGEAFGYHRMMDTAGAFVGVLFAAVALWYFGNAETSSGYRMLFALAALFACVSLASTFLVHEAHRDSKSDRGQRGGAFLESLRDSGKNIGLHFPFLLFLPSRIAAIPFCFLKPRMSGFHRYK